MPTLYLIRGCSGAGKSTFARQLAESFRCNYWEADMYFTTLNGEYRFDPALLGKAHSWCWMRFHDDILEGKDVIVSNTFTTERDLQKYIDTANNYNYKIVSLVVENRSNTKSVHDVPEATLQRQETLLRMSLKLR